MASVATAPPMTTASSSSPPLPQPAAASPYYAHPPPPPTHAYSVQHPATGYVSSQPMQSYPQYGESMSQPQMVDAQGNPIPPSHMMAAQPSPHPYPSQAYTHPHAVMSAAASSPSTAVALPPQTQPMAGQQMSTGSYVPYHPPSSVMARPMPQHPSTHPSMMHTQPAAAAQPYPMHPLSNVPAPPPVSTVSTSIRPRVQVSTAGIPDDLLQLILPGPGICLGEIAMVSRRLEKVSNDDDRTRLLFILCFPSFSGKIPDRHAKKTIRLFSGYANAELSSQAERRLAEYEGDEETIRRLAKLMDAPAHGTPQDVRTSLLQFLASPHPVFKMSKAEKQAAAAAAAAAAAPPVATAIALNGNAEPLPSSSAASAPSSRGKKKAKTTRRPPNPYLLYATEHRPSVLKEKPELSMVEVNRILGAMWSGASDEEKQPFFDKAAQVREEWIKQHPELAHMITSKKRKREDGKKEALVDAAPNHHPGEDEMSDEASESVSEHGAAAAAAQPSTSTHHVTRTPTPQPRPSTASPNHSSPPARTNGTANVNGVESSIVRSPPLSPSISAKLSASITGLIHGADLETLTLRHVKTKLATEFGEDFVVQHVRRINQLVDQALIAAP